MAKVALEKAGYEVRLVNSREVPRTTGPIMHLKVEEFAYEMWTWWYPYVPIDGRTIIVAAIQTSDGRQIDSRVFSATANGGCWFAGCEKNLEVAMAQSLTNIMNQFIAWSSGKSFRTTIAQATIQEDVRH